MTTPGGDLSTLGAAIFGGAMFVGAAAAIIAAEGRGFGLVSWFRKGWWK